MALKTKVDPFGIVKSGIVIQDTADGRSKQTAEAQGPDGFVVAIEAFGEQAAPTANYVVTGSADVTLSNIVLGSVATVSGFDAPIALASISISTKAGEAPTIAASGVMIEASGTASCTCTLSAVTVSPKFHAQIFGAATITGGQLTDCTFAAEGEIATASCDGVIKASDLVGGKLTVSGTIVGVADNGTVGTPTLTPTTGWVVTQPLTETNPNGDFPTYSFALEKKLTADTPTVQQTQGAGE